jgi:hypothetical protein
MLPRFFKPKIILNVVNVLVQGSIGVAVKKRHFTTFAPSKTNTSDAPAPTSSPKPIHSP